MSIHSPSSPPHHPIIHSSPGLPHVSAANDQDHTLPVTEPFGRPCELYSARPRHSEQACLTMRSLSVPAVDSPPTQGATDDAAVQTHEQILQPHANHVAMYSVSNVRKHAPRPRVTSVLKPRVPSISRFCLTDTERSVPPFLIEDEDAVASRNAPKRSTSPIGGFPTPTKRARIQTRLPSPTSSPLRPRPPPCLTSSPKSVGAYRFGAEDNDPDASWSTFSATRFGREPPVPGTRANRPRNGPNDGIKKSGTFTLPGVGLGRRVKFGGATDASPLPPPQDQKRRVITYLPPPLQVPNTEDGGASDKKSDYRDAKRESHKLDTCTRAKDAMIKCDVLLDSEATGGASASTTEREELDDNDPSTMVPLMDSDDATLVGEEYDLRESSPPVTVPFDMDDVSVRYPQLRTKIKEVCVLFPYEMASLSLLV
ncbi:hypothetical protein EDD15DRAFT_2207286 [Pisolithus albus]|nr:hypothetical protein EDD15DRAFT_2207286 [Pisolithus albus]